MTDRLATIRAKVNDSCEGYASLAQPVKDDLDYCLSRLEALEKVVEAAKVVSHGMWTYWQGGPPAPRTAVEALDDAITALEASGSPEWTHHASHTTAHRACHLCGGSDAD